MPDRIRKIQVRLPMVEMDWLFVKRATDHAKIRITTVRMAVAKLELTCSTPTFASIAVSPAKNAESNAQMNQFIPFIPPSSPNSHTWESPTLAHIAASGNLTSDCEVARRTEPAFL
jgi:hypothetical protein